MSVACYKMAKWHAIEFLGNFCGRNIWIGLWSVVFVLLKKGGIKNQSLLLKTKISNQCNYLAQYISSAISIVLIWTCRLSKVLIGSFQYLWNMMLNWINLQYLFHFCNGCNLRFLLVKETGGQPTRSLWQTLLECIINYFCMETSNLHKNSKSCSRA